MRLKTTILTVALSLSVLSANAADAIQFENPQFETGGIVTIKASAPDYAGEQITLRAYKQDDSLDYTDFVALEQQEIATDGSVEMIFSIPVQKEGVSTNGTYTVEYNVADGTRKKALEFEYVNFEFMLGQLRLAQTADEVTLLFDPQNAVNREALSVMGFDMSGYDKLTQQEQTAAARDFVSISDMANDSLAQLINNYSKATGVSLLNKSLVAEGLAFVNPACEGIEYAKETDEFKKWVAGAITVHLPTTVANVDSIYAECKNVYSITTCLASKIGDIISEKTADFGFDKSSSWSKYSSMSDINRGMVHDIMATRFTSVTYSYAMVVSAFESAVDELAISINNGGYAGGGGGGRPSGGVSGGASGGAVTSSIHMDSSLVKEYYSDISGYEWAREAIHALSDKNILSGYGDKTFLPEKNMTREEFVKILVLATGVYDSAAQCSFDDVAEDSWYYPYIASAVKAGLVNGVSQDRFGVGSVITRQDMAVMICRGASIKGISFTNNGASVSFTDADNISDYALESVTALCRAGIIDGMGDGSFAPTGSLTRAQAAKVTYQCYFNN